MVEVLNGWSWSFWWNLMNIYGKMYGCRSLPRLLEIDSCRVKSLLYGMMISRVSVRSLVQQGDILWEVLHSAIIGYCWLVVTARDFNWWLIDRHWWLLMGDFSMALTCFWIHGQWCNLVVNVGWLCLKIERSWLIMVYNLLNHGLLQSFFFLPRVVPGDVVKSGCFVHPFDAIEMFIAPGNLCSHYPSAWGPNTDTSEGIWSTRD